MATPRTTSPPLGVGPAWRQAQPGPLAHGVEGKAAVLAENAAAGIDDRPGRVATGETPLQLDADAVGDEAELLRLGLGGGHQAEAVGLVANGALARAGTEREHRSRQPSLIEAVQGVRLVLAAGGGAVQGEGIPPPAGARVVTGGKLGGTDLQRPLE